jgi:Tfp pilus assembly protein PilO
MDLDSLKERYKKHRLIYRLIFMALLGLVPGLYIYLDQGSVAEADRETASTEVEAAKEQFEKSKKRREDMPKLEEQLAFTEEQLEKAKAKIPDTIQINEILQKIATIAKELDVQLRDFDPDAELPGEGAFRFIKMPIKIKVSGPFVQVVSFFDRIVHLEKIILVQDVTMEGNEIEDDRSGDALVPPGGAKMTLVQKANAQREKIRIDADATIAVYRTAGANEAMPVAAAGGPPAPNDKGAGAPALATPPIPTKPGDPAANQPAAAQPAGDAGGD